MSAGEGIRHISTDDTVPVNVLRDLLMRALRHQAISDVVNERMASRAEQGSLDAHSLSAVLPELIGEVLDAATSEDWIATAEVLIEDMDDAFMEEEAES